MAALSLAGKHCAIVGATGIIGSAIARTFARQGAVLSLVSRSARSNQSDLESHLQDPPAQQAQHSKFELPRSHRFFNVDVADREAVRTAFSGKRKETVSETIKTILNCANNSFRGLRMTAELGRSIYWSIVPVSPRRRR